MSNEGFRGVPGVPDGWELVWFGKPKPGDFVLNWVGQVERWNQRNTAYVFPVIRKIEQPAKYRPFKNASDYMANKGHGFAVDWNSGDNSPGFFAVVSANRSFLWVAFGDVIQRFDWAQAFEKLQFRHLDNSTSPFGVKIDD